MKDYLVRLEVELKAESSGEAYSLVSKQLAGIESDAIVRFVDEERLQGKRFSIAWTEEQDRKTEHLLLQVGIAPHVRGYKFLKEAIKQVILNPDLMYNITSELYPTIADKVQSTPSRVERAMRHAIDVAISRGKMYRLNDILGFEFISKEEAGISNSEIIAVLVNIMRGVRK